MQVFKKYKNGDKWYQKDYRYSNSFGRVEDVVLQYYPDITLDLDEQNELPKAPLITETIYFCISIQSKKRCKRDTCV